MNEEIRKILEEIVENNGSLCYDSENMECLSCGYLEYRNDGYKHRDTCIVSRANHILKENTAEKFTEQSTREFYQT